MTVWILWNLLGQQMFCFLGLLNPVSHQICGALMNSTRMRSHLLPFYFAKTNISAVDGHPKPCRNASLHLGGVTAELWCVSRWLNIWQYHCRVKSTFILYLCISHIDLSKYIPSCIFFIHFCIYLISLIQYTCLCIYLHLHIDLYSYTFFQIYLFQLCISLYV